MNDLREKYEKYKKENLIIENQLKEEEQKLNDNLNAHEKIKIEGNIKSLNIKRAILAGKLGMLNELLDDISPFIYETEKIETINEMNFKEKILQVNISQLKEPYFYDLDHPSHGKLKYIGESENGQPNGIGILNKEILLKSKEISLDGERYDEKISTYSYVLYKGEFKNGKQNGFGIEFDGMDRIVYEGSFKDNKYDRNGKLYNFGHLVYEGEFKNNLKNGKGIEYNSSEQIIYEGEFKEGEYNGKGIRYSYYTNTVTEGIFKNGYPDKENTVYRPMQREIEAEEELEI